MLWSGGKETELLLYDIYRDWAFCVYSGEEAVIEFSHLRGPRLFLNHIVSDVEFPVHHYSPIAMLFPLLLFPRCLCSCSLFARVSVVMTKVVHVDCR